ncbi:MAG: family 10 glycosylhydrolase [Bacteroidaceae bacterium]|nr:family 10 glycosylhydrolase [Bacteroidaceae bacterium]
MKRVITVIFLLSLTVCTFCQTAPKREFRGAWIQAVNHQFEGIPAKELKAELTSQIESLSSCGINTIMFQVRVEGDALYKSDIEPWSAFLTGRQGLEPDEDWDPLQFMLELCHNHGMELHAWINPFRAKTVSTEELALAHQMSMHPERFVRYGKLALFNPALKENRDYICSIAADIVRRYDIDGFHIDDYFYPYPEDGLKFNDDADFIRDPRGFRNKDDWRRDNVNLFVEQLADTIRSIKPWVKFGISPFGIYRNKTEEYPDGSATNGFENYSGLYADVLYWLEQRWMDYCIPQLYWNVSYRIADYQELVNWWADHAYGCLMYIGQDVERTVKEKDPNNASQHQERLKMDLQRGRSELAGSCHWPAKSVVDNPGAYRDVLAKEYYATPALQPLPSRMALERPGKVRKLRIIPTVDGNVLYWTAPAGHSEEDRACKYVVYKFSEKETIDTEDASHIAGIVDNVYFRMDSADKDCIYVVTALSRVQAESKPVKIRCHVK